MTIREAVPADAAAIAGIRVASWRSTYAGIVPASILDRMDVARNAAWIERRLTDTDEAITLVVEEGGRVAGYSLLSPARDEDAAGCGEVEAIYLDPVVVGRGLGTSLMEASLARLAAAGHHVAVLWVLTANEGARRFYERAGFAPDGAARMLDFDGTPIEEIRYRRSIG